MGVCSRHSGRRAPLGVVVAIGVQCRWAFRPLEQGGTGYRTRTCTGNNGGRGVASRAQLSQWVSRPLGVMVTIGAHGSGACVYRRGRHAKGTRRCGNGANGWAHEWVGGAQMGANKLSGVGAVNGSNEVVLSFFFLLFFLGRM
jgi:hypothetical protein